MAIPNQKYLFIIQPLGYFPNADFEIHEFPSFHALNRWMDLNAEDLQDIAAIVELSPATKKKLGKVI